MYWLPRVNVLVPTDFSDASVDAMHTALAMVESAHNVHVLHVVEPIPEDLSKFELPPGFDAERSEANRRKEWDQRLSSFIIKHDLGGLAACVLTGEPALTITGYARDKEIDLIVIAAHGYEAGERISIGSVTERVLHNADCPVLVLRPDRQVSGRSSGVGVKESRGFAAVETPSRVAVDPRPR